MQAACCQRDVFVPYTTDKAAPEQQYGLWSFQTKLERFLHKNQHAQRKILNFENWLNGEVLKIGHQFSKESD